MSASMKTALVALVMMLAIPCLAATQEKSTDIMPISMEKVLAEKKLVVETAMGLTESEAAGFWPLYEGYQSELIQIRARTLSLIKSYADSYMTMTDATAKRLIDEYMTLATLELALRQGYLGPFREVLPDVKVMRFYQIENKIQAAFMNELASNIPLVKEAKAKE